MWFIMETAIASRAASSSQSRLRRLRLAVAWFAAAAALAAAAPIALAATPAPQMSLAFPSRTANVSGPGALVSVKCTGSADRECTGTLTVEGLSESHSVSYAVARGEQRDLVVPLGSERGFFAGIASPRMKAVAETMQLSGGSVRTARLLRFK